MPDLDVVLPPGFQLVSYAERPDLIRDAGHFNGSIWPEFMLHDAVVQRHWHLLEDTFLDDQLVLLDADGRIAATNNSAPLAWDGTDAGLPDGWDDQFERTAGDLATGTPVNTLGALQIVVDPARRGTGLAGVMVRAMQANAVVHGFGALIACVRPTAKHRYPLAPIERYAFWTNEDGQPFDPWVRLHVRLGARIVRGSSRAMTIRGRVAEWEGWTGMAFPDSGDYVVPFAAAPVHLDRDADEGVYYDPNIWVVHELRDSAQRHPLGSVP
ncbi:MAG: GNAT family N-acetyltransferase [Chloroflexi bacterium]|nr:GNAT family N-acetyltransferase [Chloroflexota bacterium]